MTIYEDFLGFTETRIGASAKPWIQELPGLLAEMRDRWQLEPGEPFAGSTLSYAVPATRDGEHAVVLKISYPDAWFAEETVALARWDGEGAVALIDHDPRGAQLLERAEPGTSLLAFEDENEALGIAAGVLEKLWVPDPGGIATVAGETIEWARTMLGRHHLAGRPFDRELVHEAVSAIRDLVPTQGERVLLHGDLHLGNVLRDAGPDREDRWLAIDPKPLIGEREFDVAALIRDKAEALTADPREGRLRIKERFDLLSERLELDRSRLKSWSLAILVDYAIWDFEIGAGAFGKAQAEVAKMIRSLEV